MTEQLWSSQRHRTAIGRVGLSVPARQAVVDLQLEPGTQVLDYGCGRGGDVRALQTIGLEVSGWDPVHHPDAELKPAERRNTFQHLFAASELRDYVQDTTGVRCLSAAPGIVYAFKSNEAWLSYLARQITPEAGWLASQDTASAIAAVVDHLEQRGRLPSLEEMPHPVMGILGHLRTSELKRLIEQSADPLKAEEGAKRTTLDTLLFLAVELFHGRGPARSPRRLLRYRPCLLLQRRVL